MRASSKPAPSHFLGRKLARLDKVKVSARMPGPAPPPPHFSRRLGKKKVSTCTSLSSPFFGRGKNPRSSHASQSQRARASAKKQQTHTGLLRHKRGTHLFKKKQPLGFNHFRFLGFTTYIHKLSHTPRILSLGRLCLSFIL